MKPAEERNRDCGQQALGHLREAFGERTRMHKHVANAGIADMSHLKASRRAVSQDVCDEDAAVSDFRTITKPTGTACRQLARPSSACISQRTMSRAHRSLPCCWPNSLSNTPSCRRGPGSGSERGCALRYRAPSRVGADAYKHDKNILEAARSRREGCGPAPGQRVRRRCSARCQRGSASQGTSSWRPCEVTSAAALGSARTHQATAAPCRTGKARGASHLAVPRHSP